MAHNTRIRFPGTWTPLSVLYAAELERLDAAQFAAIDGDAGGTWAPSDPVIVGGDGVHVTGTLTADDLAGHIKASKQLIVDPDGQIQVGAGTSGHLCSIVFKNYSFTGWDSGASAVWASGSAGIVQSGAGFTFASGATLTLSSGSNITVAGSSTFSSGSSLAQNSGALWALSGTSTLEAGAFFTVKPDGEFRVDGSGGHPGILRLKANSQTLVESGGAIIVESGGTVQFQSGGTVSGTVTRTGSELRSGSGAWTADRPAANGPNADATITATARGTTFVPNLTADRNWTLADPGTSGEVEHTVIQGGSPGFKLNIFDSDGVSQIGEFDTGTSVRRSITFAWTGSVWVAKTWASYTAGGGNSWITFT
jgi:hypothetical protein